MLKNYIKIAWRSLIKNKVYSAINILGLALGMAVAIFIGLWIWDEISFDHSFDNHDRIGQVMVTQTFDGHTGTQTALALPLGGELKNKYSADFKYVTHTSWNQPFILGAGQNKIAQQGMWAEANFPKMLSLQMVQGNLDALNDPSSILLTQSAAKALFGEHDPMGKAVRINNKFDLKVAGVYQDLPQNSTFYDAKMLLPWDKLISTDPYYKSAMTQWGDHNSQLFVQLNDHVDFDNVTKKIKGVSHNHFKEGNEWLLVHPMDRWHLYSNFKDGRVEGGRIQYVWLFGIIGVFVLLLACINFMNLSTARSEKRAKEVGIRKAIGSLRKQLIGQFLSESIVLALMAFVLSVVLVLLLLPMFNHVANKQIALPWASVLFWLLCIATAVFTGFVSGSYPAFYLSGFNAVKVLKGTFKAGRFAALPRKVLVVIQFTVSVTLIIGTLIVLKQINYAKDRPVGYTRQGLIAIDISTPELKGHYEALRGDLLKTGAVANMAEASSPATDIWSSQIGFDWQGKDPSTNPVFGIIGVTHDYGSTINWQIKEGRDFSRNFATDTNSFLINEALAKLIGYKEPVGSILKWNNKVFTVRGVVKDMVMNSPFTHPTPTVFTLNYDWASSIILVKLKPEMPIAQALAKIEPVFKKYNPASPFSYKFTDEEYSNKFSDEERIGNLASCFAILAIIISSLGLFGLASFVAEQRVKEIGVRKVLGASVYNLWSMLSKDFVLLVIISCFIATPIAWYFLNDWLNAYEYHTKISWWIFLIAGLGAMVITLFTVSFQAIKAALANPVKSLRSE